MAVLYVVTHGAKVCKRGRRLVVEVDDEIVREVELADLSTIVLATSVQVTTQALAAALRSKVELAFIDSRGRLLGQLTPPMPRNVSIRRVQYERERDRRWVSEWSREIVLAKVLNQRAVLRRWRYDRTGPRDVLKRAAARITSLLQQIRTASSLSELMGIEGACAAAYWRGFASALRPRDIEFGGRQAHPPPDPVNAVLSLGYSLLTHLLTSMLDAWGFDPWLGFFHRPAPGRPSLALDILEMFRAPVVDRLVVKLFNLRTLRREHFRSAGRSVLLSERGLRRFYAAWQAQAEAIDLCRLLQGQVERMIQALRQGYMQPGAAWRWRF